jgi:hypothetical protein
MSEVKSLPLTPETLLRLGMAIGAGMQDARYREDAEGEFLRVAMKQLWAAVYDALEEQPLAGRTLSPPENGKNFVRDARS